MDDNDIRTAIKEEITEQFEILFGVDIKNPESRIKLITSLQSLMEKGRIDDFTFIRHKRMAEKVRKSEINHTIWDVIRKFVITIIFAVISALISWFGINHKSN